MEGEVAAGVCRCSFLRGGRNPELVGVTIKINTGHAPLRTRLRDACNRYARDAEFTNFAMPEVGAGNGSWSVYAIGAFGTCHEATLPSRDAAEMWMVHRGE